MRPDRFTSRRARRNRAVNAIVQHSHEPVAVHVRGDCMAPLLTDGARVHVRAYASYWPGDVVVLRNNAGFSAHRVIGYLPRRRGIHLVTRGDHSLEADRPRALQDVLGRICGGDCRAEILRIPLTTRLLALLRFTTFIASATLRALRPTSTSGGLPTA